MRICHKSYFIHGEMMRWKRIMVRSFYYRITLCKDCDLKKGDKFEQVWKENDGILFASMIVNSTVCRQKTMKELTNANLE